MDSKSKRVILVVDDEEDVRDAICDILTFAGYESLCATNGMNALQLLRDRRVHLVITDLRMPVMDGWELVSALQRDPVLRRIPVCVVSSEPNAPVPRDQRFPKPFNVVSLVGTVNRILEQACSRRCAA